MDTVTDVLAAAARLGSDGRGLLRAPAPMQSWPGIVHGGGLVALLDAAARQVAGATGPRAIEARLTSPVPIDTSLALEGAADGGVVTLTVLEDRHTLSAAAINANDPPEPSTRDDWRGRADGWPLPTSEQCLACGTLNPLGLQVGLRFDDDGVWVAVQPRAPWRAPGGVLEPALAAVLLDEIAWWLGALVMKEGGLTNRIALTLHRLDVPFGAPLVGAGRFDEVKPIDRRRTFWRTETALATPDGALVATASIVFRGGPDYSSRQIPYFRSRTHPDIFGRMFPNHTTVR